MKELTKIGDSIKTKGSDKMNNTIHVHGTVRLIGRDKHGNLQFDKTYDNLITNAGFDFICNVIGLTSQPGEITHMALGSGAVGDATATTLTTETERETATYAHTPGTKTCTFTANFTTVSAATEYGLLTAASEGTLLNTAGFAAITVDALEVVATLTLS